MRDRLLEPEHLAFRSAVRDFTAREIVPRYPEWERAGVVGREVWLSAGKAGLPGIDVAAARAKCWTTELQRRIVDHCLPLHGGAGYLRESRVARAFVDTRMMPIYGGTNEVMKEIVGRSLGI